MKSYCYTYMILEVMTFEELPLYMILEVMTSDCLRAEWRG